MGLSGSWGKGCGTTSMRQEIAFPRASVEQAIQKLPVLLLNGGFGKGGRDLEDQLLAVGASARPAENQAAKACGRDFLGQILPNPRP
jgi:hypothetical protein